MYEPTEDEVAESELLSAVDVMPGDRVFTRSEWVDVEKVRTYETRDANGTKISILEWVDGLRTFTADPSAWYGVIKRK